MKHILNGRSSKKGLNNLISRPKWSNWYYTLRKKAFSMNTYHRFLAEVEYLYCLIYHQHRHCISEHKPMAYRCIFYVFSMLLR